MSEQYRPIFRLDAIQRYAQSQEKIVLPRLISSALFLYLWLLLGMLLVGDIVTWLMVVSRL